MVLGVKCYMQSGVEVQHVSTGPSGLLPVYCFRNVCVAEGIVNVNSVAVYWFSA